MRIVNSLQDVQNVLRVLLDFKTLWESKNIDLNGRRIINAGVAVDASDYVTKSELLNKLRILEEDTTVKLNSLNLTIRELEKRVYSLEHP